MNKDEVRKAVEAINLYQAFPENKPFNEGKKTLIALANLYLSGELVERVSVEKIEKVIVEVRNRRSFCRDSGREDDLVDYDTDLAQALYNLGVGKE
jgi:hypothetical protein